MSLAPPPENRFNSCEELLTGAKNWAAANGYAVTIARPKKDAVYLKCDRGGSYRDQYRVSEAQMKRRKTGSRLIDCPFSAVGNCIQGVWHLRIRNPVGSQSRQFQHPKQRTQALRATR